MEVIVHFHLGTHETIQNQHPSYNLRSFVFIKNFLISAQKLNELNWTSVHCVRWHKLHFYLKTKSQTLKNATQHFMTLPKWLVFVWTHCWVAQLKNSCSLDYDGCVIPYKAYILYVPISNLMSFVLLLTRLFSMNFQLLLLPACHLTNLFGKSLKKLAARITSD